MSTDYRGGVQVSTLGCNCPCRDSESGSHVPPRPADDASRKRDAGSLPASPRPAAWLWLRGPQRLIGQRAHAARVCHRRLQGLPLQGERAPLRMRLNAYRHLALSPCCEPLTLSRPASSGLALQQEVCARLAHMPFRAPDRERAPPRPARVPLLRAGLPRLQAGLLRARRRVRLRPRRL